MVQLLGFRSEDALNDTLIEPGSPISGLGATIPTTPGFNATILAPNGTDITSTFKIMFYRSPSIVALDGLNEKQRRKRQVDIGDEPQTKCLSPTAVFHFSHCTPKGSIAGTTRTFQVFCRERSLFKRPQRVSSNGRTRIYEDPLRYYQKPQAEPPGICGEDQICMDSSMDWVDPQNPHEKMYSIARCVSTRNFKQLPSVNDLAALTRASGDVVGSSDSDQTVYSGVENDADPSSGQYEASSSSQDMSGSRMSLRLSAMEDRPVPADIEVDVGRARAQGSSGSIESHPCVNPCLEVNTSEFPENTNWISAHARLVSTLAVAGVMWVALFH